MNELPNEIFKKIDLSKLQFLITTIQNIIGYVISYLTYYMCSGRFYFFYMST